MEEGRGVSGVRMAREIGEDGEDGRVRTESRDLGRGESGGEAGEGGGVGVEKTRRRVAERTRLDRAKKAGEVVRKRWGR